MKRRRWHVYRRFSTGVGISGYEHARTKVGAIREFSGRSIRRRDIRVTGNAWHCREAPGRVTGGTVTLDEGPRR